MIEDFKELFKNSFVYGIGKIGGALIGFLLLPLYTRVLSPADYGILETANVSISLLLVIIVSGMDNAMFRFYFDNKSSKYREKLVGVIFSFLLFSSSLVMFFLYIFKNELTIFIFDDKSYYTIYFLVIITLLIKTFRIIPLKLFRIRNESIKYATLIIIELILLVSFKVYFVVFKKAGVAGALLGGIIGSFMIIIYGFWSIKDYVKFTVDFTLLKKLLKYSLPVIPSGLAMWVLGVSDRLVLMNISGSGSVGLYGIGAKFSSAISIVISAFQLAWPQFAFSKLENENSKLIYKRVLSYFVMLTASFALILGLFSKEIIYFIADSKFYDAYKVIFPLSLGTIFLGCHFIFSIGRSAVKKMLPLIPITVLPALLNISLNFWFISRIGFIGAAYSTVISYLVMAFLSWYFSNKVYPINYEWLRIYKVLFSIIIIYILNTFLSVSLVNSIIKIFLYLCYIVFLYSKVLYDSEKSLVKKIIKDFLI